MNQLEILPAKLLTHCHLHFVKLRKQSATLLLLVFKKEYTCTIIYFKAY